MMIPWRRQAKPAHAIPESLPQPGEAWDFMDGSPFPPKISVQIREAREGWVRYKMPRLFDDNRMKLDHFLSMYRRSPNQ